MSELCFIEMNDAYIIHGGIKWIINHIDGNIHNISMLKSILKVRLVRTLIIDFILQFFIIEI